jgi:hypothetical protein
MGKPLMRFEIFFVAFEMLVAATIVVDKGWG